MNLDQWQQYLPKDMPPWGWIGIGLAFLIVAYIAAKIGKLVLQIVLGLAFLSAAGYAVWYYFIRTGIQIGG